MTGGTIDGFISTLAQTQIMNITVSTMPGTTPAMNRSITDS